MVSKGTVLYWQVRHCGGKAMRSKGIGIGLFSHATFSNAKVKL